MPTKTALVSGAKGQDAAWISRLLLNKGWTVVAFERHVQSPDYSNVKEILDHPNYILEKGDVTDLGSISRLMAKYKPDHIYHLAANSFVGCSWQEPTAVLNVNAGGTLNMLEAMRSQCPESKFLLASTSEVVGNSKDFVQNEETIPTPRSPYAVSKSCAENFVKVYRDSYGMFCCFSRCYNHEGTLRGKEFVTRKITDWIGRNHNNLEIYKGCGEFIGQPLKLGNLKSSRDWLDARDCVRGMTMILDQEVPDDFVLASGKMRSISEFLDTAFGVIGINDWKPFIGQDERYMRPDDVVTLCGDYSKAEKTLGWKPEIPFEQMVKEMVENDIKLNNKFYNEVSV